MNRRIMTFTVLGFSLLCLMGCRSKDTFGVNRSQIQETGEVIESIIEEPERREALLTLIESYKAEVLRIEKESMDLREQIYELNRDFDAPRKELEVRYDRLGELTEEFINTVAEYSLKTKALCSEEEWKKIAPKNIDPFSFSF